MGWSRRKKGSILKAGANNIWRILFWGTLLGMLAMLYCIFFRPTAYRSEATIYVSDAAAEQPAAIGSAAGSAAEISDNYAQSYIEVMTSEKALKRVRKTLSSSMTPEQLGQHITIEQKGKTAIFRIIVTYHDASSAQMLADAEAKAAVKTLESVGVAADTLDGASLPEVPIQSNILLCTLGALLIGVLVRWLIAVIAMWSDRTLQGKEDWEAVLDIPVLAEIPEREC
ncbi:MAG: YveK family protein [Butyricicoccus sp.]